MLLQALHQSHDAMAGTAASTWSQRGVDYQLYVPPAIRERLGRLMDTWQQQATTVGLRARNLIGDERAVIVATVAGVACASGMALFAVRHTSRRRSRRVRS